MHTEARMMTKILVPLLAAVGCTAAPGAPEPTRTASAALSLLPAFQGGVYVPFDNVFQIAIAGVPIGDLRGRERGSGRRQHRRSRRGAGWHHRLRLGAAREHRDADDATDERCRAQPGRGHVEPAAPDPLSAYRAPSP